MARADLDRLELILDRRQHAFDVAAEGLAAGQPQRFSANLFQKMIAPFMSVAITASSTDSSSSAWKRIWRSAFFRSVMSWIITNFRTARPKTPARRVVERSVQTTPPSFRR